MVRYSTAACSYARALAVGLVRWNHACRLCCMYFVGVMEAKQLPRLICVFACTQYGVLAYAAVSNHLI